MTMLEQKTMEIQNTCLRRIAKELERANQLKAIELKARSNELDLDIGLVDAIMKQD